MIAMKKQIIYILQLTILFFFNIAYTLPSSAQMIIRSDSPQPKHSFKFGYGFISTRTARYHASNTKLTGPIYLKYDYFADYDFTIGISLSYSNENANTLNYNRSIFGVLFKMNYVILPHKRAQPYFGCGLGFNSVNEKGYAYEYNNAQYSNSFLVNNSYHLSPFDDHSNTISGELTFGINFIIKKGFGAYFEIGAAQSVIQLGIIKTFGKNIP